MSETTLLPKSTLASEAYSGRISKTASYYAAFVALGLVSASLGPTLPNLAANTQTQLHQISILFTARSLGYLIGSLLGGRLYDRAPGHPVMALMLAAIVIMMTLVPLMSLLWVLFMVLLILGSAEGALDVGGNTLLVWVHRDKVGPFMNALHFFFGVGAFLAPLIVAQALLINGNITWAYWILALLILPVTFWILRLPSPPIQTISKDDPTGRVNHWLVASIAFFFFLYVGAEISFGGWIFTYAVSSKVAGETVAAYLTSAFWGALTIGRLLAIPIATRFRPRFILLADLIGCIASVSLMLIWPASLTVAWLGALGLGLSMASIFPTTLSLAERRMTITGQVTSLFFVGASSGAMFLPWLIGQLLDSIGPHVVMIGIVIDLILALMIFLGLISRSAHITPPTASQIKS